MKLCEECSSDARYCGHAEELAFQRKSSGWLTSTFCLVRVGSGHRLRAECGIHSRRAAFGAIAEEENRTGDIFSRIQVTRANAFRFVAREEGRAL